MYWSNEYSGGQVIAHLIMIFPQVIRERKFSIMNSAEKLQLKILACKSRMGAIIGTYNAKSATETDLFFQRDTAVPAFMLFWH